MYAHTHTHTSVQAKLRQAVLSGALPSGDFPLRSLGHFEGARGAKPTLMGYSFSASPA